MAEKTETEQEKHREPFRDTEDISLILYKRAIQQEALLKETRLREKNIREEVGKAKMRYEVAALKISKILPKKAALDDTLGRKEAKLREILERINMVKRFRDNCILYMERGNIAEKKVKETQDQIATIIRKEYENEQKLVIAFRRKDNLERLITRHNERHIASRKKYEEMLKQQHESVAMYNDVRATIIESINKAKYAYEKSVEIAPKLLVAQKKVRLLEAGVYGLEMKINAKEDELKKYKKDIEYKRQEYERLKIETMVRFEKKLHNFKFK